RDAGLADLFLQLLADCGVGRHETAGGEHADVLHGHAAVGQRTHGRLGGQVDGVAVEVLAELGHVDPEDPDVVSHQATSTGSNPKPTASVPAASAPTGTVVKRT